MNYLILPLAKNPPIGRFGPRKLQDCYRTCVKAVELKRRLVSEGHRVQIVIVSTMHIPGRMSEPEYYTSTLLELGETSPRLALQSYETIGELAGVLNLAENEQSNLIVVCTFGHYLRVLWLLRGESVELHTAFGLPRWRELLTDTLLAFVFPIIDLLGGRKWFQNKVVTERKAFSEKVSGV